jgi:glycosyltransferase involved in cell wall biosynthesis
MVPSRILILSQGIDGGVAAMTSSLAEGLAAEGVSCATLYIGRPATSPFVEEDQKKGISSASLITGRALSLQEVAGLLKSVIGVIKTVRATKPAAIVFAGFIPALLYPIFVRPWTKAKFIFWDHSPQNTFLTVKKILFPLPLRFFDRIVSISPSTAGALTDYFGIPQKKISIIYNGIVTGRWLAVPPPPDFSTLRVIMPARLDAPKDHVTLIKAAVLLHKRNIPVEVTFVGSGVREAAIRNAIREQGADGYIRLLPNSDDIPGLLAAHNIVCLSSRFEGLGLVLVEGMLAGRLALASRTSGCVDVIEDGVTGFLFTPGSAEDCAATLLGIQQRPDLKAIMDLAQKRALEKFSLQAMVNGFRNIIES